MRLFLFFMLGYLVVLPGSVKGDEFKYPGGGFVGYPVQFYEGCAADFNGNGFTDTALLINGGGGGAVKLVVIMEKTNGKELFTLYESDRAAAEYLQLSCNVEAVDVIVRDQGIIMKLRPNDIDGHVLYALQPGKGVSWLYYWQEDEFSRFQVFLND